MAVLKSKGLRWPNRAHMLIGVMSYLASPIWLALIVIGLVITGQAATAEFDYFTEEFQLFPSWPVFDSERMVMLFVLTMSVLILPKVLGLIRALFDRRLRRGVGIVPLIIGVPLETAFSVLYAPIFMLIQSQQIFEILRGRDSGWSTQQRTHHAIPWRSLYKQHGWHMAVGLFVTMLLMFVSLPLLAWMSPTLIGLILAVPLSALSGSRLADKLLRALRLLRIPEEKSPPAEIERRTAIEPALRSQVSDLTFEALLHDARLSDRHFASTTHPPRPPRGEPDLARAGASLKIAEAEHWHEALTWFTVHERMAVLCHSELFATLVASGRDRRSINAEDSTAGPRR
jgi:membrane glycosyltransferase